MKYILKALISIIITVFLTTSCATTTPTAIVPTLPSDTKFFDYYIEEPKTIEDYNTNLTILEYVYANQKMQTYELMSYISTLANDKENKELYEGKVAEIQALYGISQ